MADLSSGTQIKTHPSGGVDINLSVERFRMPSRSEVTKLSTAQKTTLLVDALATGDPQIALNAVRKLPESDRTAQSSYLQSTEIVVPLLILIHQVAAGQIDKCSMFLPREGTTSKLIKDFSLNAFQVSAEIHANSDTLDQDLHRISQLVANFRLNPNTNLAQIGLSNIWPVLILRGGEEMLDGLKGLGAPNPQDLRIQQALRYHLHHRMVYDTPTTGRELEPLMLAIGKGDPVFATPALKLAADDLVEKLSLAVKTRRHPLYREYPTLAAVLEGLQNFIYPTDLNLKDRVLVRSLITLPAEPITTIALQCEIDFIARWRSSLGISTATSRAELFDSAEFAEKIEHLLDFKGSLRDLTSRTDLALAYCVAHGLPLSDRNEILERHIAKHPKFVVRTLLGTVHQLRSRFFPSDL